MYLFRYSEHCLVVSSFQVPGAVSTCSIALFIKYCSITQNSRFWWFHLKAVCMLNLVELNYVRYQDGKLSITCGTAKYVLE